MHVTGPGTLQGIAGISLRITCSNESARESYHLASNGTKHA